MQRTIDLPPRYREQLMPLLAEHVPEAEVWAFGSRVRGGAHPTSDLDLVLRNSAAPGQPTPGRTALVNALQESAIPILIEVHDWALLPEDFREEILRGYAPIVERAAG